MSPPPVYSVALITGASSGLGEEFAMQLAAKARHLVVTARREDLLRGLADRIRNAHPRADVTVVAADLSNSAECDRLVEELKQRGLEPDLLVNNAGMGDYGEFASADWSKLEAMIRLNMEALTHLTHGFLPGMIRRGVGAVINVSSLASLLPIPDFAVYAATKAYVTSFSEALRIELRGHRIPVLAVCPGPVRTGFGHVARRSPDSRIPMSEWFCVPKEQVVAESIMALQKDRARVYPAWKTAAAAVVISALPIVLMRLVMASRPRK
jgi:short-subunit dehydrogenase